VAGLTEQEVEAVAKQASAAGEQVRVSREVDLPNDRGPTYVQLSQLPPDATQEFSLAVRNVGAGLALIGEVRMCWSDARNPAGGVAVYFGTVDASVLPPGEWMRPEFLFPPSQSGHVELFTANGRFWIEVDYSDAGGRQHETSRLICEREASADSSGFRVTGLELEREGDVEPYVASQAR